MSYKAGDGRRVAEGRTGSHLISAEFQFYQTKRDLERMVTKHCERVDITEPYKNDEDSKIYLTCISL